MNLSTAEQYKTAQPPFVINDVQEGTMYSFIVFLESDKGYRSHGSEQVSYVDNTRSKFVHPVLTLTINELVLIWTGRNLFKII